MSEALRALRAAVVVTVVAGLFWVTGSLASVIGSETLDTSILAMALAHYGRDASAPLAPLSGDVQTAVHRDSLPSEPAGGPSASPSGGPTPTPGGSGPKPSPSGPAPSPTGSKPTPTPTPIIPLPLPTLPLPTPTPTLPVPAPTLPMPTPSPTLLIPMP